MTREEFHTFFKVAMDKNAQGIAFGGCPAFLPEEIDYWLNLALYNVVLSKYAGKNEKSITFEKSVKRTHDLEGLVCTDKNCTAYADGTTDNGIYIEADTNKTRMLFVSARVNTKKDGVKVSQAIVQLVAHEVAELYKQTYNNVPWVENPVGVLEKNRLYIYLDPVLYKDALDKKKTDVTVTVDITYLRYPTKINEIPTGESLTELPDHVYHEVIDAAVLLALEDIESQRIQAKSQLNTADDQL